MVSESGEVSRRFGLAARGGTAMSTRLGPPSLDVRLRGVPRPNRAEVSKPSVLSALRAITASSSGQVPTDAKWRPEQVGHSTSSSWLVMTPFSSRHAKRDPTSQRARRPRHWRRDGLRLRVEQLPRRRGHEWSELPARPGRPRIPDRIRPPVAPKPTRSPAAPPFPAWPSPVPRAARLLAAQQQPRPDNRTATVARPSRAP